MPEHPMSSTLPTPEQCPGRRERYPGNSPCPPCRAPAAVVTTRPGTGPAAPTAMPPYYAFAGSAWSRMIPAQAGRATDTRCGSE